MLLTLYKNDWCKIEGSISKSLIRNEWLRPATYEEMLQTGAKIEELLIETNSKNLLLSALRLGTVTPETKEWLTNVYYKSISETGVKRVARVLPENVFSRLSLEAVVTRAEALGAIKFEVKNFSNEEDAFSWLKMQF